MLLPVGSAFALAAGEDQGSSDAVVFTLTKVSETTDEVKVMFSVTEGRVLCFDATVKTAEGLVCSAIDYTSVYMSYIIGNDNGAYAKNPESAMLSFANPEELNGPLDIATFTFIKSEATGVTMADFSVEINSCYQKGENDDVAVTPETVIAIPETHEHIAAGEWVVLNDSTCIAEGEEVRYCSECGMVAESRKIEKKEHTIVEEKKDATCEEDGYIIKKCSVCNQEFGRTELGATGHNPIHETKAATCTENGYDRYVCDTCKKVLSETILYATGHKNTVEQHQDATCEENGYDRVFCNDCQQVVSETVIPATGHKNTVNQHQDATCEENGYDRVFCNDCQQVISETIIPATGHKNTVNQHQDATCTEDGYDRVFCNDCQKVISETVIKAEGHKVVTEHKDATCTEDGYHKEYCSVCQEVFKDEKYEATGHLNQRTDTLEATCEEDGYIRVICDDCHTLIKETILPAAGHKFVNNIKKETCTTDGYIEIMCSKCKLVKSKVILTAPGHSWSEWKVIKEPTYRSVGTERKTCRSCGLYEERELPMIKVPVQQIIIVPEKDFTIYAKKADRLQATVLPEEAAYSAEIVWESSNPKIVSVDKDGNIKALRKGTATITAKTADGTVSASRKITVDYSWLQWIIIVLLFGWIWYL